jgi:Calx-beta domain/Domain of unknown function (DUF4214)
MTVWQKVFKQLLHPISPIRRGRPANLALEILEDRCVPANFYVNANGGSDANTGLSPNQSLATIQQALNLAKALANGSPAQNNNNIAVAVGTYTYDDALAGDSKSLGLPAVVGVVDQEVNIAGGYNAAFTSVVGTSTIDGDATGGLQVHGVSVVASSKLTGVTMANFVIQDCEASPSSITGTLDSFGGGMIIDMGATQGSNPTDTLTNITFKQDTAQGAASTGNNSGSGGDAGGGGLAAFFANDVTLNNVTFNDNAARGGNGPVRGGSGLGGGLYGGNGSHFQGTTVSFLNNEAIGANASGVGNIGGNQFAEGFGGGAALLNQGTSASFTSVTATGNTAQGGNAGSASGDEAGDARGGAFYSENANVSLTNATLSSNTAAGGTAADGGEATVGGAIYATAFTNAVTLTLNQVSLLNNTVNGANVTGTAAPVYGGGLASDEANGEALTVNAENTVIAGNTVNAPGSGAVNSGGGGVWSNGVTVNLTQDTIANNTVQANMVGPAILLQTGADNLAFDIVANNAPTSQPAVDVIEGGTVTLVSNNLFANNGSPTGFSGSASNLLTASDAGFVNASGGDFHLTATSPAVGQAAGTTDTIDRDGSPRGASPTLGAFNVGTSTSPPPPVSPPPPPPGIEFTTLDFSAPVTAGSIPITVTLPAAQTQTVTVHYATSNGSAIAGTNYTPESGTLTFNPGVTTQTFSIPIVDNTAQQGNLRIELALSNPTGLPLGSDLTQAVATIVGIQPSDNAEFISGLYNDLLGRPSDAGGLNFYLTPLNQAEDQVLPSVLLNFVASQGYYARLAGDPVNGYYIHYLGRQASNDEANFWGNQQAFNGLTDEQVIADFVSSTEFYGDSNNNNLTFLQNAYQDILGRPLDAAGQSFYLPQITSDPASRAAVAMSLLTSDEYRTDQIDNFFLTYLNRPTNANDRQYWLGQFQAGQTDEQIIVGIGGSAEGFVNNGDTNVNWITSLYQKTLGRSPSASELAFHLNQLENDAVTLFDNPYYAQRFNTAQALLSSAEYKSNPQAPINLSASLDTVISQTFQTGLGKTATAEDLAFWSSQFVGNANQNLDVASAILASSDYFSEPHKYP